MDTATWVVGVVAALAVVVATARAIERVTVYEYERGLRYRRGRFAGVVGPGVYWLFRPVSSLAKLDVRPRAVSVPGQEVLSVDGVTLRVSLAAEYRIADPAVAVNEVEDFAGALYLTLQLALREIVGGTQIDELLERRSELGGRLLELGRPRAEKLGLELERVELKDIMFPGGLKQMFAQVVGARKEGLAALERARGETAALRNLANAARMMETNPSLLQLRLLQQLASGGNTVVLGFPSSTTPLPLQPPQDVVEPPELPPEAAS